MTTPLPTGFAVTVDPTAAEIGPGLWAGGRPLRVLRLTDTASRAWDELRSGRPVTGRTSGLVARRLTDAGLAHPVPPPTPTPGVTVVVPVHGRAAELDRCLDALPAGYPVVVVDDASPDPGAIAAVAQRHRADLVRLAVNRGPAGAREAGLARVLTPLVAFVDSDTVPSGDWIEVLARHLADEGVAAAAPRVVTSSTRAGWCGTYLRARGVLDLGPQAAAVAPYSAVSYVPTAALVARVADLRAVARDGAVFDPDLRYGEDVDLVWRLVAAGHRVRYDASVEVPHVEVGTWADHLRRRHAYGTSAAPLAARHPDDVAPFVVHPWFTAAVLAALARRPVLAAVAAGGALRASLATARDSGLPADHLVRATGRGLVQTWLGLGRCATQFAAPLLAYSLARGPAGRRVAAASLVLGPALGAWWPRRRAIGPARWTAAYVADEIAYGSGVLRGCLTSRTVRPLTPRPFRRS